MISSSLRSELKRKSFHLLALLYVMALFLFPRHVFLWIVSGLLLGDIVVEYLRLNNSSFQTWFVKYFNPILRPEEQAKISGVFWMILGVLSAALLLPSNTLVAATLLFMTMGDLAASLVGKSVGGPHWYRSPKRLSGSLACFGVCLILGALILRPDYSWTGIFAASTAGALLEVGYIPVNDNFLIPFGCSLVLNLCYGLHPFTF